MVQINCPQWNDCNDDFRNIHTKDLIHNYNIYRKECLQMAEKSVKVIEGKLNLTLDEMNPKMLRTVGGTFKWQNVTFIPVINGQKQKIINRSDMGRI